VPSVSTWLRGLPRRWPHRGQTRLTLVLDRWLRQLPETIYPVGALRFPFLQGEDQRNMFYGLYEPSTVTFLQTWLRPGDTFIDVGANVGYLSAVAADRVGPAGQVYAFEPEPGHFARLRRLAELNPSFRIVPNRSAVGDHQGTVQLFMSPHAGWHTIVPGFNQGLFGCQGRLDVPIVSLDAYAAEHGIGSQGTIRLVKVDVEGAEAAVLRGAADLIRIRAIDAFLVEVTPPDFQHPTEPLSTMFAQMRCAAYKAYAQRPGASGWQEVNASHIEAQTMILWTRGGQTSGVRDD